MQAYGVTGSRGRKSDLDKFYTKPDIASLYLAKLDLNSYDTIIEPSAGSGAFSHAIPNCKAFDIAPEHDGILQADWLQLDKTQFQGRTLVIGNPPFGRGGSIAMQFIHAAAFADTIAFILPRGFKKDSVKNRVPKNLHLVLEEDVPKNAFTVHGEDYDVPCVFQVWERRETLREPVQLKRSSTLFEILPARRKLEADFRVQRVGGSAGRAYLSLEGTEGNNYFVKNMSNISTETLMECINELSYPSLDHTTGPKSLPKGEFIHCVEEAVVERGLIAESALHTEADNARIPLF